MADAAGSGGQDVSRGNEAPPVGKNRPAPVGALQPSHSRYTLSDYLLFPFFFMSLALAFMLACLPFALIARALGYHAPRCHTCGTSEEVSRWADTAEVYCPACHDLLRLRDPRWTPPESPHV